MSPSRRRSSASSDKGVWCGNAPILTGGFTKVPFCHSTGTNWPFHALRMGYKSANRIQGATYMTDLTVKPGQLIERVLSMELVRVTERAAVSAARLRGRGDEKQADQAAVDAMRRELNRLPIDGTVVIGEGERDEAPMLFIGERVGNKTGPKVDIAVDPLEGTTLCAKDMPGAIAVMAMAEAGSLLNAPDVYMDKIAVGPGYPPGIVDLDRSPEENIAAVAKAKGVAPSEVTALIMDRPRHAELIAAVRKTGASIRLITDGDVAGVIFCAMPESTGIDIYLGIGGAPEGVLAAAALRCVGGQMQGRLILDTPAKRERAAKMGVSDPNRKYDMKEMAAGDVIVSLTGVTDGALVSGVRFGAEVIETETLVYRSITGTVRKIRGEHRQFDKFKLD
jgi:fructose-1,6-bisphosphatase II / sedoheptulose-1,7-bisphosphatase